MKMDVIETLRYMAELWDNAVPNITGEWWVINPDTLGLCDTLDALQYDDKITKHVKHYICYELIEKLENHPPNDEPWSTFKWPQDETGAKCRAQWCRETADKLETDNDESNKGREISSVG